MTKKVIETTNGWYMENPKQKVELDDIVGLVKTDEPTDSVQLKKEAQLNICERKLLDMKEDRDYYKTKSTSLEEDYIKLQKENEQLKQFFKQLKGSGYWNDDYLTEQDWFDVKQWIERVCKKGDVE